MRRSPLIWLVLAACVLAIAWYVVTPRRTWERFSRGVVIGDQATLQATIDYPILRENLKRDLRRLITIAPGVPDAVGDLSGILINPLVDASITPEGLGRLIAGFGMGATNEGRFVPSRTRFAYRGLSRVDVQLWPEDGTPADGGIFTFHRSGLTWRLTRVWSTRIDNSETGP